MLTQSDSISVRANFSLVAEVVVEVVVAEEVVGEEVLDTVEMEFSSSEKNVMSNELHGVIAVRLMVSRILEPIRLLISG